MNTTTDMPGYQHNDGGRAIAGYKGTTGDCGVRAAAIATGKPYAEVYDALFVIAKEWKGNSRRAKAIRAKASPRRGVFKEVMNAYMESIGWKQSMINRVRLDELAKRIDLPAGSDNAPGVVLSIRKHYTALVDNTIHDTWDCRKTSGAFTDGIQMPHAVTRIWAAE